MLTYATPFAVHLAMQTVYRAVAFVSVPTELFSRTLLSLRTSEARASASPSKVLGTSA